ncbi:SDR family NAD(P)-dependent oxidoreductase [Lacisediminimonas profundi]|uniref:SDR family NAD(P)-dependent oxidoreductase n=1 Tax=Lacisediminimonas profundi TaxID=2603856 RepID=UPI00124B665D|nr:SDR family oxidoreductase [Lacisediminimonas profundi]
MAQQQRIVVVTGGASGIGAACAEVLAQDGWKVVVADINLAQAQQVAQRIGGVAWEIDVASDASVAQAAAGIESEVGPVYGLVNSAGIIQQPLPPHELGMDAFDRVQQIDFRGTYVACREFARAMLARKAGSIVNISSVAGSRSMRLHSYSPAKAAVINMTQCLAAEWGANWVRVNAVAPGYTLTPALEGAIARGERQVDGALANSPLPRLVQPTEIANGVAFLLSDRASAITGINVPIDCGWLSGTTWDMYGGLPHTNQ